MASSKSVMLKRRLYGSRLPLSLICSTQSWNLPVSMRYAWELGGSSFSEEDLFDLRWGFGLRFLWEEEWKFGSLHRRWSLSWLIQMACFQISCCSSIFLGPCFWNRRYLSDFGKGFNKSQSFWFPEGPRYLRLAILETKHSWLCISAFRCLLRVAGNLSWNLCPGLKETVVLGKAGYNVWLG